jgi:hypothetical protein
MANMKATTVAKAEYIAELSLGRNKTGELNF